MKKKSQKPKGQMEENPASSIDGADAVEELLRRQDTVEWITVTLPGGVPAALPGCLTFEILRGLMGLDPTPPSVWAKHFEIVRDTGEVVPLVSRIGADGRPAFEVGDALVRRIGSSTQPCDVVPVFADRPEGRGR